MKIIVEIDAYNASTAALTGEYRDCWFPGENGQISIDKAYVPDDTDDSFVLLPFLKAYDPNPETGLVPVVFVWASVHGDCYDCGLPAAFERYDEKYQHKLCAVCAANAAADGENIRRLG